MGFEVLSVVPTINNVATGALRSHFVAGCGHAQGDGQIADDASKETQTFAVSADFGAIGFPSVIQRVPCLHQDRKSGCTCAELGTVPQHISFRCKDHRDSRRCGS